MKLGRTEGGRKCREAVDRGEGRAKVGAEGSSDAWDGHVVRPGIISGCVLSPVDFYPWVTERSRLVPDSRRKREGCP